MEHTSLGSTSELMESTNYKDRFLAEYLQLDYRFKKLKEMIRKWDDGTLSFVPTCPRELYDFQLKSMDDYRKVLRIRASIEGVELPLC